MPRSETLPSHCKKLFVHENYAGSGYLAPEQHLVDLPFSDTAQFRDDKIFVYEKLKQLAAKFANVIKKDKLFEQNILGQEFRTRNFFVRLAE